jgi:hypothetical protein
MSVTAGSTGFAASYSVSYCRRRCKPSGTSRGTTGRASAEKNPVVRHDRFLMRLQAAC